MNGKDIFDIVPREDITRQVSQKVNRAVRAEVLKWAVNEEQIIISAMRRGKEIVSAKRYNPQDLHRSKIGYSNMRDLLVEETIETLIRDVNKERKWISRN